jgi:uncharacterized protein
MARVEVVFCAGPGQADAVTLDLPAGATLADALNHSGLLQRHGLALDQAAFGIWGKKRAADTPLREHDRVELYRLLQVDPKEARRQRYKRHRTGA